MSDASFDSPPSQGGSTCPQDAGFSDFFALLKPRVMSLVVFTALVGLMAAPMPVHPVVGFTAILFIAIGGGASGALNMWWDADIDRIMKRTRKRPIPSGRITEPRDQSGRGGSAGIHHFLLRRDLLDVAQALDTAKHRHRRRRRRFPPDDRLGCGDGHRQHRISADVRTHLYVDAAAFLGAGPLHEVGLR
jgi:hypothetical protein